MYFKPLISVCACVCALTLTLNNLKVSSIYKSTRLSTENYTHSITPDPPHVYVTISIILGAEHDLQSFNTHVLLLFYIPVRG